MGILDNITGLFRQNVSERKEAPQVFMNSHTPYHARRDNFKAYADEGLSKERHCISLRE